MTHLAIVCVDDQKVVLESLKEQLKRHLGDSCEVETADSGEEALDIIEELHADGIEVAAIVADQIMPGMKGDRLLIRVHEQYPKILKIMLTGQADAQAVGNAVNAASLYRYITKPWDETDLVLTVKEALRRYTQDRQLAEQNEALRQVNQELEQFNASLAEKVAEQTAELQLLLDTSQEISAAPDFDTALEVALRQLGQATGWLYGEAWVPATDRSALVCNSRWYSRGNIDPDLAAGLEGFRDYSTGLTLLPNEDIPGQVWARRESLWVADIGEIDDVFLRLEVAAGLGIQAGFGVPIFGAGDWELEANLARQENSPSPPTPILGILVFFTLESSQDSQRLRELVAAVAAQLGTVLQQKKTQAEMKTLFAAMTDVVLVRDVSGRCLNIIPTNTGNFYKLPEELLGRTLHDDFPSDRADSILNGIQQAVTRQQTVNIEYSLPIDGREVWLATTISPLSEETAMLVGRDISDRKQAEQAVQEKEQYLRLILDNIPQQVFWKDLDLVFRGCNKNWAQAAGLPNPEAAVGKTDYDLLPDPKIAEAFRAQDRQIIATDLPQLHIVASKVNPDRDGQTIWLDISKIPIHDAQGNVVGILGVLEDITLRKRAEEALQAEQQKSERLLLNILPAAIAEQLKQKERAIAEHFDEVSILFADIVNFTPLAARLTPTELVDLLNQIFSCFDRLAEERGLEKIKTIGDAYMVVGGLPVPRPDCAEAVAEMALDMQTAIARFKNNAREQLQVRIGIHTGAAIAGVIGMTKFSYDLWGDAVNVAARMESSGLPGKIQVTGQTYERLKHRYSFEERGAVSIKGKGDMRTYWLTGRRSGNLPQY